MTGGLYVLCELPHGGGSQLCRSAAVDAVFAIGFCNRLRARGLDSLIVSADRQTADDIPMAENWQCFADQVMQQPARQAPQILQPCKH